MSRKVYLDFQDGNGFIDVTDYVKFDTLEITLNAFSSNFHYAQNEARFSVIYDPTIYPLLRYNTKEVIVRIVDIYDAGGYINSEASQRIITEAGFYLITETSGITALFYGRIPPTKNREYNGILDNTIIQVEALDELTLLDTKVGDVAYKDYYIMNPDNKANSIVHQLCYIAGLTDSQIDQTISIMDTISVFVPPSPDETVLNVLDTLLYEYGYVLNMDVAGKVSPIKWIIGNEQGVTHTFTDDNIIVNVSIKDELKKYDGAEVTYYEVDTLKSDLPQQDTLIYRDTNLPIDDKGLFTGYSIPVGYTYPVKTNTIDETTGLPQVVYQDFDDTALRYWTNKAIKNSLDYNYKAFDSDYSDMLLVENCRLDWYGEPGIDLIKSEFHNRKAEVIFKNNALTAQNIYYFLIYGKVYYKSAERKSIVKNVDPAKNLENYVSTFLFTKAKADLLAKYMAKQSEITATNYTFQAEENISSGAFVNITLDDGTNQNCIIVSKTWNEAEELYDYELCSYDRDVGTLDSQTVSESPAQPAPVYVTSGLDTVYASVNADIDGSIEDFPTVTTRMSVFLMGANDSDAWNYSVQLSGITGTLGTGTDKNLLTITGFTSNETVTGSAIITATKTGYSDQVAVFDVQKLIQYTTKAIQVSGGLIYKYDDPSGTPSPTNLVLTATSLGFTPTTYQWQYLSGSTWTNFTNSSGKVEGATTDTLTLYYDASPWTGVNILRTRCVADSTYADEVQLVKIYDGADGTSVVIKGSVPTVGDLPVGATIGDIWVVLADGDGYMWNGSTWDNIGPIQGPQGDPGQSQYLFIRYSAYSDGTDFSDVVNTYIGTAVTTVNVAPTNKADYTWSRFEGQQGIPGYTIVLDNEAHNIMVNLTEVPVTGEIGIDGRANCSIIAYRGTTQLTAVAEGATPTTGQFKYVISATTNCTAGRKDNDTFYIDTVSDRKGDITVYVYPESGTNYVVKKMTWLKGTDSSIAQSIDSKASTALADAEAALNDLATYAADGVVKPLEKRMVKIQWNSIVDEYTRLIDEATNYGISSVNYTNAYNALNTALNTQWDVFVDMAADTTLNQGLITEDGNILITEDGLTLITEDGRNAWNTFWNDYYYESIQLANAIVAKAKTLADNAQADADTANSLLADISSDSKLTAVEKASLRKEWDEVNSEKPGIDAQADYYSITTEKSTYNTKFVALNTYMNDGVAWTIGAPLWISDAQLSVTTNIVGATFRNYWKEFYDSRQALLNKIVLEAENKAYSDATTDSNAYTDEQIPLQAPRYLGKFLEFSGLPTGNIGDTALVYTMTSGDRGIYLKTSGGWLKQTTPTTEMIGNAWADICWAQNNGYGVVTDYTGSGTNFIDVLVSNAAFIATLATQNLTIQNSTSTLRQTSTAGEIKFEKFNGSTWDITGYIGGDNLLLDDTSNNLVIGWDTPSLTSFDGSFDNVILGNQAGKYTTSPSARNVFVGFECGRGAFDTNGGIYNTGLANVCIGRSVLRYNEIGNNNVGIGLRALYSNKSGDFNNAIGIDALYSNESGISNIAIGFSSLYKCLSGSNNIGFGYGSLYECTSGYGNIALGYQSALNLIEGYDNIALGYQALKQVGNFYRNIGIGFQALYDNTGNYNVVVGHISGATATTSNYITLLGNATDVTDPGSSYATAIGAGAIVSSSNTIRMGRASTDTLRGYNYTADSDRRLKENIIDIPLGIDFVKKLRPVFYKWKDRRYTDGILQTYSRNHAGFIAQEIGELLKNEGIDFGVYQDAGFSKGITDELPIDFENYKDPSDLKGVAECQIIPVLTKAIQELITRIEVLESKGV